MMVVPRQYAQVPRKSRSSEFSEKRSYRSSRSSSNSPRAGSPTPSSLFGSRESSPVKSKSRSNSLRRKSKGPEDERVPERPHPTLLFEKEPRRRESVKDVLSATAIPIRKKQGGRPSQRLPRVDHVANFSSLLMGDVKPSANGGIPRSISSSNFDGLFGNMDELLEDGQMYVGSEDLDSGILSTRSLSDDSLTSLPSPDDYMASDRTSQHSSTSQGIPERRIRQMATSEDCSDDHPLSPPMDVDDLLTSPSPNNPTPPPTRRALPGKRDYRSHPLLKSSLTASLRALKLAAQSVSNRSSSESVNYRAKSFFEFHPELTDDRRPPPSFDKPTPELRRYLNPPPLDSAAQLHFWQDYRHSKFEPKPTKESRKRIARNRKSLVSRGLAPDGSNPLVRDLPPVVQLADCLPGPIRTENASSPPIWLAPDGSPINKNTAIPLLFDPNGNDGKGEPVLFKHREPRENRDFLRVFVCEMEMRRAGKLSDDVSAGRAKLWLPPVNSDGNNAPSHPRKESDTLAAPSKGKVGNKKSAGERMMCMSIEDV